MYSIAYLYIYTLVVSGKGLQAMLLVSSYIMQYVLTHIWFGDFSMAANACVPSNRCNQQKAICNDRLLLTGTATVPHRKDDSHITALNMEHDCCFSRAPEKRGRGHSESSAKANVFILSRFHAIL